MFWKKSGLLALVVVGAFAVNLHAQEISERRDLSIFRVNYFGAPLAQPQGVDISIVGDKTRVSVSIRGSGSDSVDRLFQQAVGALDQQIQEVFVNLGRFTVSGLPQRLTSEDVGQFIDQIREFREANMEMPEAVLLGQQAFTEADFNRIVGGFIVVIPSITYYSVEPNRQRTSYEATIDTAFAFVNVETAETFAQFSVETTGRADNQAEALRNAVNNIATQLTFEIRSVDEFRIRTAVVGVEGPDIMLQFGTDMGVVLGDEYAVQRTRTVGTFVTNDETALIVIKDVREQYSVGQVVYADPAVVEGDQLIEIPRMGFDAHAYANAMLTVGDGVAVGAVIGVQSTLTRGFYGFRPRAALDIVLGVGSFDGYLPIGLTVGGEYNLILGRLRVAPSVAVGVNGLVPVSAGGSDFILSHLRAQAQARLGFLLDRDFELFAEVGYVQMISVASYFPGFGGILAGAGVTLKL